MDEDSAAITRRDLLRGAAGVAGVAGASGLASAQEDGGDGGGGGNQSGGGGGGGGTETVEVGPGGDFTFVPGTSEPLYITPGTTVNFVWDSDNHNIVVGEQPSDANWEGTPGSADKTYNTGYEYSYTFEVLGKYHYWCEPHKSVGMIADIEVTESLPEEGGHASILPDSAKTLGVATVGAMTSILGLAYVFMKYGGDYSQALEETEE
jgi:plastocyanin